MFSRSLLIVSMTFMSGCGGCGGDAPGLDPDADLRPDAASMCPDPPPAVCDFFLQCGCDPGEKCSRGADGPACVPVGIKPVGEPCGDDTECVAGSVCVNYGGELRCLQYCDDMHACPVGDACFIIVNDEAGAQIGEACGQACSLLAQDCEFDMFGCYAASFHPVMEEGVCVLAGAGVSGTVCTSANDCAEGLTCIEDTGGTGSTCLAYCDRVDSDPGCQAGESCVALADQTQTGVCR